MQTRTFEGLFTTDEKQYTVCNQRRDGNIIFLQVTFMLKFFPVSIYVALISTN